MAINADWHAKNKMPKNAMMEQRARWHEEHGREFKSIPQGAATSVWAAVVADANEIGGRYCEDCHVAEVTEDPLVMSGVRPHAIDPAHAEALWARSEELVGERFSARLNGSAP